MALLKVLKIGRQGEGERRDGARMKGLTVENLSTGILSEYSHSLCSLVPMPPQLFLFVCFSSSLCVQYNTHKWKSGKKRGNPGNT